MTQQVHVGIDLAWSTGTTGLAGVADSGRLLSSTSVQDDEQIADWLEQLPRPPRVVAVDAPLVVPNDTGQRLAERLIGQTFGRYGAFAHSANRTLMGGEPRGMRLARRFGWNVDPHARPSGDQTVCIEVYPHPALIGLFRLPYRLAYKKGSIAARLPEFVALLNHLETIPELQLPAQPRWQQIRQAVAARQPGVLGRYEDEVDAIVCAHLAWLWQHRPGSLHVYGTLDEGYIVAPPPPTHLPVKPNPPASKRPVDTAATGTSQLRRRQASARKAAGPGSAAQRLATDAAEVRAMLIDRIAQGTAVVSYGEVAAHVGRIPNGLGPLLDEVADRCAARGEPNLAVLVVNKGSGEPTKYADRPDYWQAEQQRCRHHQWTR